MSICEGSSKGSDPLAPARALATPTLPQGDRGELSERNRHAADILAHGLPHVFSHRRRRSLDPTTAFDFLFVCGDLNYRLGPPFDAASRAYALPKDARSTFEARRYWESVAREIDARDFVALRARDQLQKQIDAGAAFFGFDAGTSSLSFAPTYKLRGVEPNGREISREIVREMAEEEHKAPTGGEQQLGGCGGGFVGSGFNAASDAYAVHASLLVAMSSSSRQLVHDGLHIIPQ